MDTTVAAVLFSIVHNIKSKAAFSAAQSNVPEVARKTAKRVKATMGYVVAPSMSIISTGNNERH